jgi:hypothetical protein
MKQVTFAPRHHQLTNTNTWTADSQWLVFDVRPSGASFTGETIERVNVDTGRLRSSIVPDGRARWRGDRSSIDR